MQPSPTIVNVDLLSIVTLLADAKVAGIYPRRREWPGVINNCSPGISIWLIAWP